MKICRLDSKKRLVLPGGTPGDWMLVEETATGTYLLKRMEIPQLTRKGKPAARKAIRENPLRMQMDWATLKKLTREP